MQQLCNHNTLPVSTLVTFTLHYVAATFFIRFGKWERVQYLALKLRKDAAKIGGEMPHFNNSTVI
jgi:hypothetical protein